jgi:hypothetical protein
MPMMQKLNELWQRSELDSLQSLWFRTPKPEEELYDLQQDPYELVNLAGKEELQDTLLLLRNVMNEWITSTKDLGQFPEEELLAGWLENGNAPKLPPLELEDKAGKIILISRQKDATIIWKQARDTTWQFYADPFSNDQSFQAKAVRIGFEDSEVLDYEVD